MSSLYGSDAVGGVINYVMKRDYEGLETTLRVGAPEAGGGENLQLGVAFGLPLAQGRGRIFGSVDALYRLREADWMALPGVGRTTAAALMAEIERSKRAELWRFIAGLSIPQVGPATAKLLPTSSARPSPAPWVVPRTSLPSTAALRACAAP